MSPPNLLIQCIYAITKRVILAVGEDEIGEGEELLGHVLERQISYFADWDGLVALFKHLGDSPWCEILLSSRVVSMRRIGVGHSLCGNTLMRTSETLSAV